MSFFLDVVSVLGGSVALVAATAWLAREFVSNWLQKDLEEYKGGVQKTVDDHKMGLQQNLEGFKSGLAGDVASAMEKLKFDYEKELILRRGEVDVFRDELRNWNETEEKRQERIRAQVQRWANPILGAVRDLQWRLENIVENQGHIAMASTPTKTTPNWSADYNYFMASTLYYFAQYFCWVRMMENQLSHELFHSGSEMDSFKRNIESVGRELSEYPYPETEKNKATQRGSPDKQVFRLQQRAIGELILMRNESGEQILSYREFLDRWLNPDDSRFRRHLEPLETFLRDVSPKQTMRWTRLKGMRKKLTDFEELCQDILVHKN